MSPPSDTLVHALGHNWLGKVDIAVQTVLLAIGLIVVSLRFWSKRSQQNSFQANDWLITAATVLMLGRYVVEVALILLCGLGLHAPEVERTGGPQALVKFKQLTYAGDLLWFITVGLIQLSILHCSMRRFQDRVTLWSTYVVMGLCSALLIASLLATAFFCTPPSKIWLTDLNGHCGDRKLLHTGSEVSEVILDALILLVPLPAIRHIGVSTFRMIALGGIYALGIVIIAISAVRIKLQFDLDPEDPTYSSARQSLLSCIVPLLGIIVACLPLLPPVFQKSSRTSTLVSTTHKQNPGPVSTGYWKAPASSAAQIEDPEIPLVSVRRPSMARKLHELALGQITITSDWEIHSARNSARSSARLDRDSIRQA